MRIEERRSGLFLILVYKMEAKKGGPEYIITERFTRRADAHAYSSRNRFHRFLVPVRRTRMLEISFRVAAVGLWNV